MRDYIDIETTPCEEKCEQLGPNYDPVKARAEARAMVHMIQRQFGEPPPGVTVKIASNPHDFGSYLSVRLHFNTDDEEQGHWCYNVDENLAHEWDHEAQVELGLVLPMVMAG